MCVLEDFTAPIILHTTDTINLHILLYILNFIFKINPVSNRTVNIINPHRVPDIMPFFNLLILAKYPDTKLPIPKHSMFIIDIIPKLTSALDTNIAPKQVVINIDKIPTMEESSILIL